MKNKLTKALLLLALPVLYFAFAGNRTDERSVSTSTEYSKVQLIPVSPPPPDFKDEFVNIIFNSGYDHSRPELFYINRLKALKDTLHFNAVHNYFHQDTIYGNKLGQSLETWQRNNMRALMDSIYNAGLLGVFNRNRIADAVLNSQRVIYEVSETGGTAANYGFTWINVMDTVYRIDSGRTVLKASSGIDQAGWLCDSVYENMQHSDLLGTWGWSDKAYPWYLKPTMRINTGVNDTTPIVKIMINKFNGELLDSFIIRARHFGSGYSGQYIDKYFDGAAPFDMIFSGKDSADGINDGWHYVYDDCGVNRDCAVDFKIYWYGYTDVWFDKLVVDNEHANQLFNGEFDPDIVEEVNEFWENHPDKNYFFFVDELAVSRVSPAKYVFDLARDSVPGVKMSFAMTNYFNYLGTRQEVPLSFRLLLDSIKPDVFTFDVHEFNTWNLLPNNLPAQYGAGPYAHSSWFQPYIDYNNYLQKKVFGDKSDATGRTPDATYSTCVVGDIPPPWGSFVYQVRQARYYADEYSPDSKMIIQPQLHSGVLLESGQNMYNRESGMREPTNEEIQAQAVIALSHGVDGLCWFIYETFGYDASDPGLDYNSPATSPAVQTDLHHHGLGMPNSNTIRTHNMYGQPKGAYVAAMNLKFLSWKQTLDVIDWYEGYSVHTETSNKEFIDDIKSIYRDASSPFDLNDLNEDAVKYWEMGFFNPKDNSDKGKYFLMVNRRCVPEISGGDGDLRKLKIKFDDAALAGFNNWKIIDMEDNSVIATFDKNAGQYIDMGMYDPGEGKLYKLTPVMHEGGTLVCDEETGIDFDCKGEVLNDGFDITLNPGCDITFTTAGTITMTGGEFKTGNIGDGPSVPGVTLTGKDTYWDGLTLTGSEVDMYRTHVEDIAGYMNSSVKLYNCDPVKIDACTFISTLSSPSLGAILGSYAWEGDGAPAIEISGNVFDMGTTASPVVSFLSTGSGSVPVMISNNIFNPETEYEGSMGIFLSGIIGGVIEYNTINDLNTGISLLSTTIDLHDNDLSANVEMEGTIGIFGASGTVMNMSSLAYGSGVNRILNYGEGSRNIETDNALYNIHEGYNTFDMYQRPEYSYHLTGTYTYSSLSFYVPAEYNCFKIAGTLDGAHHTVVWEGTSDPVPFDFEDYMCVANYEPGEYIVVDLGNEIYDTIYIGGEFSMFNDQYKGGNSAGKVKVEEAEGMSELYNLICLETRKRNYDEVSDKAYEFLDEYADSSFFAIDVIAKLYMGVMAEDSAGVKMGILKSYLEELILDHGENSALVERAFYYIQKCKASLGDYESAMDGFNQIVTQNPGTYEALVASWDYAAVSLMGGSSGGNSNYQLSMNNVQYEDEETIEEIASQWLAIEDDPRDKYDQTKFTKEDRKTIRVNVVNSYKDKRDKKAENEKQLEIKAGNGDETAKQQLETKKALKDEVKVYKPETMQEHVAKMNASIQKVFGRTVKRSDKTVSIIPNKFDLGQNYPNPFNPVTKISYDLPKDAKVKLVVYDILGREVANLVNNEFRTAGRYIVNFNGSNLASGIYFYRIETDTQEKWKMVKKMVLVK